MAEKRLKIEAAKLAADPPEGIIAMPTPQNPLVWYFKVEGPKETAYEGGEYVGRIRFPDKYPFAPPSFQMLTPSGRFLPSSEICLSMSDFMPETWNPAWNVSTMLVGLVSFMVSEDEAFGAFSGSTKERRGFAAASIAFNKKIRETKGLFETFPNKNAQVRAKGSKCARGEGVGDGGGEGEVCTHQGLPKPKQGPRIEK